MSEIYKGHYTNLAQPAEEGVYRVGVVTTVTRYLDVKASSQEEANKEAKRYYDEEIHSRDDWKWDVEEEEEFDHVFEADI